MINELFQRSFNVHKVDNALSDCILHPIMFSLSLDAFSKTDAVRFERVDGGDRGEEKRKEVRRRRRRRATAAER